MMPARSLITTHTLRTATMGRAVVGRGFSLSTSTRLGLKESSSQTDQDYDKHKRDSLEKQKKGSGHWKPELASDSEEAVKADRSSKEGVSELQERTKRAAEETSKAGTSVRDGM
ncbi:hypothetical protein ACCO45_003745 [Purpureocillium lilacinum]|uniref:Uncharacterized protein n=2 Tax=Purpureocillium lilacinum TaxID=33203 RepID=A0ACC4E212_PURLI|nr:hypothetical protein PLICBS_007392 [Purpureocillium lilacinum]